MAKESGSRKRRYDMREAQCKNWAGNTEIVQCLKAIINWAEEDNSSASNVYENVYDWANNIVWYSKMLDSM